MGWMEMSTTLSFGWPKPPLSLNDRPAHWAARNEAVQAVRQAAMLQARGRINRGALGTGHPIEVTLIWYFGDRPKTRRDADNPVATLKALCDGLVDAGVVPDDTPDWMTKKPVRIEYRAGRPGVDLLIETVAEADRRVAALLMDEMGCAPWHTTPSDPWQACEIHDQIEWAGTVCGMALRLSQTARGA